MLSAPVAQFPSEATKSSSLEDEILNAYEARDKLAQAIHTQDQKRVDGGLELAKKFANDLHVVPLDVEDAFKRDEAWKVTDQQIQQRIAALTDLQAKNEQLIERYKADVPDVVNTALNKWRATLVKSSTEKSGEAEDLKKKIAAVDRELESLPKPPKESYSDSASEAAPTKASKK